MKIASKATGNTSKLERIHPVFICGIKPGSDEKSGELFQMLTGLHVQFEHFPSRKYFTGDELPYNDFESRSVCVKSSSRIFSVATAVRGAVCLMLWSPPQFPERQIASALTARLAYLARLC